MIYNEETAKLAKDYDSNLHNGLTSEQVLVNREKYGRNELEKKKKVPMWQRFLLQFKDALTIILIIAAVVSIAIEPDEWIESMIIFFVVVVNAILGLVQENNAEKALEALEKMAAPKAKVIRDGTLQTIDSNEVVVGDILILDAGDRIASDGRIVESANLKVDESALTGESVPVEKHMNLIAKDDVPLGDRLNMVFSSCNVTYGRGVVLVSATGKDNEVGKIATMIAQTQKQRTPLQVQLDNIGKAVGIICLVIVVVVFGIQIYSDMGILEAFKTSIALAVAAIPEGLATVVTVVLALSVSKMAQHNAIVKSLPAVETLGATSIVCSDKTGTLTQNKMTVVKTYLDGDAIENVETATSKTIKMLNYFTLCSDGQISIVDEREVEIGDPTETALVKASLVNGYPKGELDKLHPRVGELAFDSDRKMMTVIVKDGDGFLQITKGGPDVVFGRCVSQENGHRIDANKTMAQDALRVLAVAIRHHEKLPATIDSETLEKDLIFIGLVGMIDPPREEAKKAIMEAKKAGVRTVMITGDHVETAAAIAGSLNILEPGQQAVTGDQLNAMSDEELAQNVDKYAVYARVAPEHKVRIVRAWQAQNKVVAMTGDGVNDAPALKQADIGCAMGITGTDVAKGAASMILTDDNFATIIHSIKEGRGIYDNIKKDVQFLLSSNIGEVITIFGASLITLFTDAKFGVPLLPIHLLWVNLITDSLPAFALGMEPVEEDIMQRKPRSKTEGFFAHGLGFTIAWQGLMIGVFTLIAYAIGNAIDHETGMTMAFITLCGSQLVHSFNVKTRHSILSRRLFTNIYLWGALGCGMLLQIVLLAVPELSEIFRLQPLHIEQWYICLGFCFGTVAISEIVKFVTRKNYR